MGASLSNANKQLLWVPPGFAHGFYVTSEEAGLQYQYTDCYAPEQARYIRWDDWGVEIEWTAKCSDMLISNKDSEVIML